MFTKLMPHFAALSLALLLQCPVYAADPATVELSTTDVRTSIGQAIQAEKSRRNKAIVGMVVGGVVILTGVVVSAVNASLNKDDENNYGQKGDRNETTGTLIGAAVGLPILGISLYQFFDAQSDIRQLRRQSATLSFTEQHGAPGLRLAMTF